MTSDAIHKALKPYLLRLQKLHGDGVCIQIKLMRPRFGVTVYDPKGRGELKSVTVHDSLGKIIQGGSLSE